MTTSRRTTTASDSPFLLGGDLEIRRIGLGTMRLTDATGDGTHAGAQIWRAPTEADDAIALLRSAVDRGVQLVDTADAYALGQSEELIARALHPYRDDLVVATKVGNVRPSATEWVPLGHPAYLKQQVELSLRRLRLERIDLVQLHRLDPAYPIADQVGALADLREEGKVRHIGLSEISVAQLDEALAAAPVAAVQNRYNLVDREHDAVLDRSADEGIAFLPFFPLAIGDLALAGSPVADIASELRATPSQVALAWLLRRAANVLPIPGTTSIAHLEENLGARALTLDDARFERLSGLSGPAAR